MLLRVTLCVSALVASALPAAAADPLDLTPADALLCWTGRPYPDLTPREAARHGSFATLLDLGARLAGKPLDVKAQITLRVAEAFPHIIRHPHAFVLIDAKAEPIAAGETGRRLDELKFALLVKTEDQTPFVRVIQKIINEQTDDARATLTLRETRGVKYQVLHDSKLPAWCELAWGRIGDHFVFTIGRGVFAEITAVAAGERRAMRSDPWMIKARGKRSSEALIEIVVQAERICEELDPWVQGRATDFFEAWDVGNVRRAHWALGFEGNALYCLAHFQRGDRTVAHYFADPGFKDPAYLSTIPKNARYAVFQMDAGKLLYRIFAGLHATRDVKGRREVSRAWEMIQEKEGFRAQEQVLDHLGDRIIVHNYPTHPLRLPLAVTTLIEIDSEPATVKATIERMCDAWRNHLQQEALEKDIFNPAMLDRDSDGIWSLRFGPFAGPAWTVTDRFIITSYSPHALRTYLRKADDAALHLPAKTTDAAKAESR